MKRIKFLYNSKNKNKTILNKVLVDFISDEQIIEISNKNSFEKISHILTKYAIDFFYDDVNNLYIVLLNLEINVPRFVDTIENIRTCKPILLDNKLILVYQNGLDIGSFFNIFTKIKENVKRRE